MRRLYGSSSVGSGVPKGYWRPTDSERREESAERITDVWCLPTSTGKNGHGAEFPLALAGRCIALTSRQGDLVLNGFIGSGTTALATEELGRRCVGFDISEKYVNVAKQRLEAVARQGQLKVDASDVLGAGEMAV